MPTKNAKKTGPNTYELEIVLDKEAFDQETNRVFHKNAARMNVPGFRRGKAPRSIIEKMYGKEVFYSDAIDALLPEAYRAAIEAEKLDVIDRPDIELVSVDDSGVRLKATVTVKPTVKITDYTGIPVVKEPVTVTAEEVTKEIDSVRERNARQLTIEDEPAALNDTVVLDYTGYLDDVPFDGGSAEKHPLKLGSHDFIPGFEEQIVGHMIGEEFDISVTFPEEYGEASLAGKEARFHIRIHEIKRSELPELDDEFVKDVSSFDTVDEYKADVEKQITERKNRSVEYQVEKQITDYLVEHLEADIPNVMIENEIDGQVSDYDYRMQSQGLSLDMYFKYTGQTMEQLRESFRGEAERQVKIRLALEKIAKSEKIKAGKKDIEEKYKELASKYNVELDYVKKSISEDSLSADITAQKTLDFLKENAAVSESKPEVVEKSADKPVKPKKASKKKAESEEA